MCRQPTITVLSSGAIHWRMCEFVLSIIGAVLASSSWKEAISMRRKFLNDFVSVICSSCSSAWYAPCVVLFAIHGCIQTFHFRFLLFSFSCAKTAITATAAAAASLSALSAVFVVKVSCTRTCMNLHENLMQETCARNLCKILAQVSWLYVTTISQPRLLPMFTDVYIKRSVWPVSLTGRAGIIQIKRQTGSKREDYCTACDWHRWAASMTPPTGSDWQLSISRCPRGWAAPGGWRHWSRAYAGVTHRSVITSQQVFKGGAFTVSCRRTFLCNLFCSFYYLSVSEVTVIVVIVSASCFK